MRRLFKIYENITIVMVPGVVLCLLANTEWIRGDGHVYMAMLFTFVLLSLLVEVKAFILYMRVANLGGKALSSIKPWFIAIRAFCVVAFFAICALLINGPFQSLIFMSAPFINYVLPQIITESIYVTKNAIICKGIMYDYSQITRIRYNDSGGNFIYMGNKKYEVKYLNAEKNTMVYNDIVEKIEKKGASL